VLERTIGAGMTHRVLESVAACTPVLASYAVHAYVASIAILTVEYLSGWTLRTVRRCKIMLISARCYDSGVNVDQSYSTPGLRNGLPVAGYADVVHGATVVGSPGSVLALAYAVFVASAVHIVKPNLFDGMTALSCTVV